jgi:hypothetical protein
LISGYFRVGGEAHGSRLKLQGESKKAASADTDHFSTTNNKSQGRAIRKNGRQFRDRGDVLHPSDFKR